MRYVVRGNDCVYGKVRYRSLPPITTFANTVTTTQSAETKDVVAVSKEAAAESKLSLGVKRPAVSHILKSFISRICSHTHNSRRTIPTRRPRSPRSSGWLSPARRRKRTR